MINNRCISIDDIIYLDDKSYLVRDGYDVIKFPDEPDFHSPYFELINIGNKDDRIKMKIFKTIGNK